MKNTFFKANLISLKRIRVLIFAGFTLAPNPSFMLKKDDGSQEKLKIVKHTSNQIISLYELEMSNSFEFGHNYLIAVDSLGHEPIDVSEATEFPEFDSLFYYEGTDLGATYYKDHTEFALWAPLASKVYLLLEDENHEIHSHRMHRKEKGVYRLNMEGDLLNRKYRYSVTNGGVTQDATDPWGKGSSTNSLYSVVVDINAIKAMGTVKPTNKISQPSENIIYELNIRDFTEDKHTNIVNKGKYLGMVEPNRKTEGGNPAGLDYLKYLGVTTIQILPVIDFKTVDEANTAKKYNWGYDPISFFALEGSYSLNPDNGMTRLIEFKTMINELHKNNIRVVMDVVYNHIYEYMDSCFEKIVPNYFFRRRSNGQIACASGCGDDVASERSMVRKAITESLKYFTEVFDVDGFRFDLMGLLDIKTVNQGLKMCKEIRPDTYFYGEGWNMGLELPLDMKACAENADKMPEVGFFNDVFRNVLKGPQYQSELNIKGFTGGSYQEIVMIGYCFAGCTLDSPRPHRFINANQSINYVECHDNNTIYDKLVASNAEEDEAMILKRVRFANSLVMFSFGVPLFHMGQEIGQSKSGLDNTYNTLNINNMRWDLVDERIDMINFFRMLTKIRKEKLPVFSFNKGEDIKKIFDYQRWGNGIFCIESNKEEYIKPYKKLVFLTNPTSHNITYELDDYYSTIVGERKDKEGVHTKYGMIPPCSVQGFYIK